MDTDDKPRLYRHGYGVLGENLNMVADPGERKSISKSATTGRVMSFWHGPPAAEQRESNYQLLTRQLCIVLAQASDGKRLYETTVVSEGKNGSLAAVMPYMVRSAFTDFSGKNGVPHRVELKMP